MKQHTSRKLWALLLSLMLFLPGACASPNKGEPSPESTRQDAGTERSVTEPTPDTRSEPTGNEPTGNEPTGNEPTGNEPTGNEPTGNEPTGSEPTGNEPTGSEPTGNEPTGNETMPDAGESMPETAPVDMGDAGPMPEGQEATTTETMPTETPTETPPEGGLQAQTWSKAFGSTGYDGGYSVTTNAQGDIFFLGAYNGTISLDGNSLTSRGDADLFVAKLNSAGNVAWVKSFGGTGTDYGWWLEADGQGNVFVTGYFAGSATFGSTTLTSAGGSDIFVAKLDTAGNVTWAKSFGGTSDDYGYGIAVNAQSEVFLSGRGGTMTFGSTTLTSAGASDVIVAKLDANGTPVWAKRAGGSGDDAGYSLVIDSNNNVYVAGTFNAAATFGSLTAVTSKGDADIFITKLDSTGTFSWLKAFGSNGVDSTLGIRADSAGNLYVSGDFSAAMTVGTTSVTNAGSIDIFAVKLDSAGNFTWAKSFGGTGEDYGYGIAVDPTTGVSYITGAYESTATFGTTTLTPKGPWDGVVITLDSSGNVTKAISAGGTSDDNAYVPALDNAGGLLVVGDFEGTTTLFDGKSYTSNGDYDGFIVRFPR